jgi:PAS domain S-box-containing protein
MTYVIGALLLAVASLGALLIREMRQARAERALRESEERFRRMVDRSPILLWTIRADATLDYFNHSCVEFTGLPMEKLLEDGWLQAVHPDDLDYCLRSYLPAIEARTPFSFEYRVRRADGAYRWLLASGIPKYGPDGRYEGYVGCDVDITESKKAEHLIRESQAAAKLSHLEIQEVAGRLLTVHEGERRRLARELHDDLTQQLARLAIDAGSMESAVGAPDGLRALREDLVRLSEVVHAMSSRLHPSVLDDLGLIEALKAECARVARHGALRVEVNACDVPGALSAEASLCLFRVAQEALSNASRHAHASAVTVLLAPSSKGLQLAVSDNGSGFDPERPRERASLGLASMRERVRLLQGKFEIESTPGRGTTVVAWVPA